MGRSLNVGIALGFALLHVGCGRGTLAGGGAGISGGSAGAGGSVVLTGTGGSIIVTGAGGSGDPFTECARPQPANALPPNFLIVLDTSATMNSLACAAGCGSASRWGIAVDAINATTGVSLANWGLDLFADATNLCGTIDAVGVPFGPGAAQQIATALAMRTTFGGDMANPSYRPTRNAIAAATGYLAGQTTANRSFIVLVTTGVPGCAAGAGDPLTDDSTATVQAITYAFNSGFQTFVVGLGTLDEAAQASLANMAAAGGGTLGAAGHRGYLAVTSSVDLQSALRSLASDNEGCTFEIPPPPNDFARRDSIIVSMNGLELPRDTTHADGWDYVDARFTSIELYGPACNAAKVNRTQPPMIRFRCPLI